MTRSIALLAAALLCQACADRLNLGGQTSGTAGNTTGSKATTSTGSTTGTGPAGCSLIVTPSSIAFGDVAVGATPAPFQQITFTNTCSYPIALSIGTESTAPEFTITDASGLIVPTALQTLGDGASYVVSVAFEPTASAAVTSSFGYTACLPGGTLCVNEQAIDLSGTGVTAGLTLSPSPAVFTATEAGKAVSQTITVTNSGSDAATVTCLYLQSLGASACGSASTSFALGTLSLLLPATLQAGGSFTFPVTYTASTGAGSASDVLAAGYTPQGAATSLTATDQLIGNGPSTGNPGALPQVLIVEDASGSMCEPIGGGVATNSETGCASNQTQSKAALVASAMETTLAALTPSGLQLGLSTVPDKVDASAGQCQAAAQPLYALGDATSTLPQITAWFQTLPGVIGGGTPTAQTLLNAAAQFANAGSGPKFVVLITDGLPNCDDDSPCVFDPQNNLWSDGEAHGCVSPSYENLQAGEGGRAGATPPAQCQCSEGSCTDPDGGSAGVDCCVIDTQLLSSSSPSYSQELTEASEDCLDTSSTVGAIVSLAAQGITTYVVGVGQDFASHPEVLTQMARAGAPGQSDAGFFDAQSAATLQSALSTIFSQAAP